MRLHLAGAGRRAILIKARVQRYGDVADLLIIQAANGVFLIKLQRRSILQYLNTDAFCHTATGLFIEQRAHSRRRAGSQRSGKRGADVGIPGFAQAAAALQIDIKIFPARGSAHPFQVTAPDGAHIDIHILPAHHRTGGRDHGDGVGAQIGFEDRVAAALPVIGGVFSRRQGAAAGGCRSFDYLQGKARSLQRIVGGTRYPRRKDVGIDDIDRRAAAAETHADTRHVGGIDFIPEVRGPWRNNLRREAVGAGGTAIARAAGGAHRPVAGEDHRPHRQIRRHHHPAHHHVQHHRWRRKARTDGPGRGGSQRH